ncbi:hypothetical protein [Stenotrophomonas sp. B1-1]|uniref:hypothetical protein n=1 Tax=Stenotrophomonas sp. B1-1 TaxID=2710648 RepID=UPI0013DC30D6|nr:hypothetical protein [Stenotrophomonas sp. B1-1]
MDDSSTTKTSTQTAAPTVAPTAADSRTAEQRQKFNDRCTALRQAVDDKHAMHDRVAKLKQLQSAAQGEADQAKAAWSSALRESNGEITRAIHKLRAAERSALALVEEYEVMAQELATDSERLELRVAECHADASGVRHGLVALAKDSTYAKFLNEGADCLAAAYQLYLDDANCGVPYRSQIDPDQLASNFMRKVLADIKSRGGSHAAKAIIASAIGVGAVPHAGVDPALAASPVRRMQLRKKLGLQS